MIDSGSKIAPSRSPGRAGRAPEDRAGRVLARAHPQPRRGRTSGELICFLTQDATPCPGWLAAYREAFTLDARVGVAYGPHLPRPETSPMIARELNEFFASFSPDGTPVVQRAGDRPSSRTSTRVTRGSAGRRSASATCPTPRTRPSAKTSSRPAGARSTTRAPPSCTPTNTPRSGSCAATSTSTAGCARRRATSSRSRPPDGWAGAARGRGGPPLDGRAGHHGLRGGAMDSALDRAPRGPQGVLGAGLACGQPARTGAPGLLAGAPRRTARPAPRRPERHAGHRCTGAPPTTHVRGKLSREVYEVAAHVWANGPRRCSIQRRGPPSASACAWRW